MFSNQLIVSITDANLEITRIPCIKSNRDHIKWCWNGNIETWRIPFFSIYTLMIIHKHQTCSNHVSLSDTQLSICVCIWLSFLVKKSGIVDLQCCDYCHLLRGFSSRFQSSVTINSSLYNWYDAKKTPNFVEVIGMDFIQISIHPW